MRALFYEQVFNYYKNLTIKSLMSLILSDYNAPNYKTRSKRAVQGAILMERKYAFTLFNTAGSITQ